MKLTRSNYRMIAVVGIVLALGTGSVLSTTDSANAAGRGVELQKMACMEKAAVVEETDVVSEAQIIDVNAAGERVAAAVPQGPGFLTVTKTITKTVTSISKSITSITKTVTKTLSQITKTVTSFISSATSNVPTTIPTDTITTFADLPECAG